MLILSFKGTGNTRWILNRPVFKMEIKDFLHFRVEPFSEGSKTILTELPPLKMYPFTSRTKLRKENER